jgi:hypothetical protein
MSGLQITSGPAVEPITRIEAREHLRLDDDVDDAQVRAYILAARIWAENFTGRAFINRTVHQWLDGFLPVDTPLWEGWKTGPSTAYYQNHLELALAPVASVTEIKYYSDDDTEYTWAASNYYVDTVREPSRIVLRDGANFPTNLRAANGLKIVYEAGYGTQGLSVPEPIRVAMLQYCTFLYEHRGDNVENPTPPAVLNQLLISYQIMRFGSTPFQNIVRTGIG